MPKRKYKNKKSYTLKASIKIILIITLFIGVYYFLIDNPNHVEEYNTPDLSIQHQFLSINPYSRSGKSLSHVKGIVIHYTGNPNSSAMNNRRYFENLRFTHTTKASSHFIIGLKGEVIQCIPLNEIAYASNQRNKDTISIECCHPDESGRFNKATYQSLQILVRALMQTYDLNKNDIIRHYDVTGKNCPKYFVTHPKAWEDFKDSLNHSYE